MLVLVIAFWTFYPQENRGATVWPLKVHTLLTTKGNNSLVAEFGTAHPKHFGWNFIGNSIHRKSVSKKGASAKRLTAYVRLIGKINYFPDSSQVWNIGPLKSREISCRQSYPSAIWKRLQETSVSALALLKQLLEIFPEGSFGVEGEAAEQTKQCNFSSS